MSLRPNYGETTFEVVAVNTETSLDTAIPIGMELQKFCNRKLGVTNSVSPVAHDLSDRVVGEAPAGLAEGPAEVCSVET